MGKTLYETLNEKMSEGAKVGLVSTQVELKSSWKEFDRIPFNLGMQVNVKHESFYAFIWVK